MIFGLGFGGVKNHFFKIEVLDNWNCVFFSAQEPARTRVFLRAGFFYAILFAARWRGGNRAANKV